MGTVTSYFFKARHGGHPFLYTYALGELGVTVENFEETRSDVNHSVS